MMEVRIQLLLRSDLITVSAETSLLACLWRQGHQGLLDHACAAHPALLDALARHGQEHVVPSRRLRRPLTSPQDHSRACLVRPLYYNSVSGTESAHHSYVEEQQGENANVIKVLEVQNMLSGKVMDGTKLVQPSRRYVREAAATKHERDGKQFPVCVLLLIYLACVGSLAHHRHLFLFNDILIWSKPKKADTHEVIKLDSLITLIVKDAGTNLAEYS